MSPRIKICCISSREEASLAIACGASALGLVAAMPSGPGVIGEELIAEIAETIPPPIASFLLTSETSADAIISQQRRCRTNTIQLCDEVEAGTYDALREALPGISLVQVIHVKGSESISQAKGVAKHVDAILLDSGNPSLEIKELGGTGRVHDWALSKIIREECGVPLFLAGGLKAENVARAIATVQPFGLDLCSSVRTEGRLDPRKLRAFMEACGVG